MSKKKILVYLAVIVLAALVVTVFVYHGKYTDAARKIDELKSQQATAQETQKAVEDELAAVQEAQKAVEDELAAAQEAQKAAEDEAAAAQEAQKAAEDELTKAQEAQKAAEDELAAAQEAQKAAEDEAAKAKKSAEDEAAKAQEAQKSAEDELAKAQKAAEEAEAQLQQMEERVKELENRQVSESAEKRFTSKCEQISLIVPEGANASASETGKIQVTFSNGGLVVLHRPVLGEGGCENEITLTWADVEAEALNQLLATVQVDAAEGQEVQKADEEKRFTGKDVKVSLIAPDGANASNGANGVILVTFPGGGLVVFRNGEDENEIMVKWAGVEAEALNQLLATVQVQAD